MSADSENPVRVLHLLRWLHPEGGGIRAYMASLARALEGLPVKTQAAAVEAGEAPRYLPDVPHLGRADVGILINAWRFWIWAWRGVKQADVVHIHNIFGWPFLLGALACALRGVPFVVCPHAALDDWYFARKTLKKKIFLKLIGVPLLRRSRGLVATTPANADAIRSVIPRIPIHLVPPGVPVESRPGAEGISGNVSDDSLRVLYLGRLDQVKEVPTLIRAIGQLRAEGVNARLDIVGWGTPESMREAEDVISELSLDNVVRFRGYLDGEEKQRALAQASVLAIPSRCENFSFATAEAMAVGLPVVVTTGVALSTLVERARCGTVVPPGDVQALARALEEYRSPTICRERGLKAHQCALAELSLEAMGRSLVTLYRATAQPTP